jgi:ribosomal protein S12 methylthiotransferase
VKHISLITLGCSKNLVDSEHIARQLDAAGYSIMFDTDDFNEIVIINTCGFIHDAKEESISVILHAIEAKKAGLVKYVYVIGCLSERYADELQEEIAEVDAFLGARNIMDVLQVLNVTEEKKILHERLISTPSHVAYLKIAEGCDRTCSFCAIPAIRGKHISVPIEDIVAEARFLAKQGVRELCVISQDVSYYGYDLYGESALDRLLEDLEQIDGIEWIRLHYLYPNNFPVEILERMKMSSKICHYLDMPLQHISDSVLRSMRRGFTREKTFALVQKIRQQVPDIVLRTTLLVGHPGETEEDFNELVQFVKDMRFDRLGVFTYSHEDGTYAEKHFSDDIPEHVKQERADFIMELQQQISYEKNLELVGKELTVIIDRREEAGVVGRTQYDSYEVDNEVYIPDNSLQVGAMYSVTITRADMYDLEAQLVTK